VINIHYFLAEDVYILIYYVANSLWQELEEELNKLLKTDSFHRDQNMLINWQRTPAEGSDAQLA